MNFQEWYDQTLGHQIDIDGAYGDQCVDVAMSWAQFCFPGHQWPELLGHGDAKDLFGAANPDFFEKLTGITPTQGDMVVFGATPTNPYGHIAVVISADASHMQVIEQNGFNPSGVAYVATRPYNNIIGYLRPKGEQNMSTPLAPNLVDDLYGAYTGHQPTETDHANWDGKPVEELMAALASTPDTINYNALKAHNAEEAAKVPALEAKIAELEGKLAELPAQPTPVENPVTPVTPPAFPEIHVQQKSLLQVIGDFLSKIFIGTKKG